MINHPSLSHQFKPQPPIQALATETFDLNPSSSHQFKPQPLKSKFNTTETTEREKETERREKVRRGRRLKRESKELDKIMKFKFTFSEQ